MAGLAFVVTMMIPNVAYVLKCRPQFEIYWHNKLANIIEIIARYSCAAFMIFNIPGAVKGFSSSNTYALYLTLDVALVISYDFIYFTLLQKNSMFKALSLSIIASIIFIFSAVITKSIPLLISSIVFAPLHILICYKNYQLRKKIKENHLA